MSFRKKISVRPLLPKGKSGSSINGDSKQWTISEEPKTFNSTDLEHSKLKTGSKNKSMLLFYIFLWYYLGKHMFLQGYILRFSDASILVWVPKLFVQTKEELMQ